MRFGYNHQDESVSYQGSIFDFSTRRDELRLRHELEFGEQDQHSWTTFLRFDDERGDLARDELNLVTRLSLEHSDWLSTVYRYGLYTFKQGELDVDQHTFDVEALIQPTDDTLLSLSGFGLDERARSQFNTDQYGGRVDFDYHWPNPLGELDVNMAFSYDRSKTSGPGGQGIVIDEQIVLDDVRVSRLRNLFIVPGSVVVHNSNRTRFYRPGLDYIIGYAGAFVTIKRVVGGRISEGEVVYVDYLYSVPTRMIVQSFNSDLLIEHRFNFNLTPYYYLEARCEDVDEESFGLRRSRDNMHRHRAGMRYDQDTWSAGFEFEVFDDAVEPYNAAHMNGQWRILRDFNHTLGVSGQMSWFCFEGGIDARDVTRLDLALNDRIQFTPYMSLDSAVAYRYQDDSVAGYTNALDVTSTLAYTRNYLTIELTVEYDLLSLPGSREDGFGVFLNLRRSLAHLLPGIGTMQ
jgi:hypothetical protein